jgi:hypothetical protein
MIISKNSQLGLRFRDNSCKIGCINIIEKAITSEIEKINSNISKLETLKNMNGNGELDLTSLSQDVFDSVGYEISYVENGKTETKVNELIRLANNEKDIFIALYTEDKDNRYYFICDSVYKASELIKIGENFTSRTLKDVKFGMYTYLMGKHKMLRFICVLGAIKGFYYDEKNKLAFEWGCLLEDGEYFFPRIYQKEFSLIMQILTFVELGDIDVKMINGGQNNGKPKDDGKVTNMSNNTVYVVDSSWNSIIIRTTGFAVRGHYRLQPCGEGMKDRKLMWISAFEKHGYKRRPKGEII